jgi:NAD dependent epimerase/dehydratase family enzyme
MPLAHAAGSVLGRPSWLPVPDFALQTLLGEGANVVLEGQRVVPSRAQVPFHHFYPSGHLSVCLCVVCSWTQKAS